MTIGSAVQRGSLVFIRDERGRQIGTAPAGGGTLLGFTGSSVSIRRGNLVFIYDERGRQTGTAPG